MNVILCKLLLNYVFGNKNNIITAVTVLLVQEETAVSEKILQPSTSHLQTLSYILSSKPGNERESISQLW
jgi:hypothetical protein